MPRPFHIEPPRSRADDRLSVDAAAAKSDSVLRERRRHAGEALACAVLPRLRECCHGSGHPVGQLAVEGSLCRLRGQPSDLVPLGRNALCIPARPAWLGRSRISRSASAGR